jgi:hypothetical protein
MASTVNPLYVSENAPRAIRGLLTGLYQFNIVTGLCVSLPLPGGLLTYLAADPLRLRPASLLSG